MELQEDGGDDPRVGTTVASRYFLHRLLGRGGMGDVFEATRLDDDRPVALKLLRAGPDEGRLLRFEREAALAARLRHPGCVEVVESGRDPEAGHFLAMELVSGRDLSRVLEDEGPLPPARAARVADGILAVLATAHAAGVVHRDLKPANVMLEEAAGVERVKVLDFGIATFLDPAPGERPLTSDGVAHGTPAYMSPEQIRGEAVDARADLYAVGAILFELLAGAPAFGAPTPMAVAARQLTEDAPPLASRRPDVPAALAALVAHALDRDPARRPASAEAMRAALRAAVPGLDAPGDAGGRPTPATEAFPAMTPRPGGRARRWGVAVGVTAAAVALAVGAVGRITGAARTPGTGTATAASPEAASRPSTSTSTSTTTATATSASPSAVAKAGTATRASRSAAPKPSTSTSTSTTTTTSTATATSPVMATSPVTATAASPSAAAVRVTGEPTGTADSSAIRVVGGALGSVPTPGVETGDGVLVLQAAPWAIVTVDGVALGETPREVRLAAGTHEVRGVHPELGERAQRVTVKPGARLLWSVSFER